jgi:hypothetical protein
MEKVQKYGKSNKSKDDGRNGCKVVYVYVNEIPEF